MTPQDSITDAIRAAKAKGQPALVGYVTAGFPSCDGFIDQLQAVASVADVVEIGVPFTDPMADGPTIQRSSRVALANGVSLKWILEQLTSARVKPRAPVLLMSYLNPLLAYGLDRLPADASRAGVAGFIVPDLPLEESADLQGALQARGIALVQLVTPVTPVERMHTLCASSGGFVYAVTMTGVTGRSVAASQDVLDYFARVKSISAVPVCAGFGIRSREQIERIAPYVDGVVVASAAIEIIERGGDPAGFLRSLRA